jgi:hypothetical protein
MITIRYDGTEAEEKRIIQEQTGKGLTLLQVANIIEGNFLQFNDVYVQPLPPLDITV